MLTRCKHEINKSLRKLSTKERCSPNRVPSKNRFDCNRMLSIKPWLYVYVLSLSTSLQLKYYAVTVVRLSGTVISTSINCKPSSVRVVNMSVVNFVNTFLIPDLIWNKLNCTKQKNYGKRGFSQAWTWPTFRESYPIRILQATNNFMNKETWKDTVEMW